MTETINLNVNDSDIWMVRAGKGGIYAQRFLENGIVSIGWAEVGEIDADATLAEIKQRFDETFPDDKPRTRISSASQVIRFLREIQVDDTVATYDVNTREYHIGKISSAASLGVTKEEDRERSEFVRGVEWLYQVSRDSLTPGTRNSLGAISTLFRLSSDPSQEIREKCMESLGLRPSKTEALPQLDNIGLAEPTSSEDLLEDYSSRAEQLVEDRIAKLSWDQMQELVAGILRAMGYRTRVSSPGPDRGVDVSASPDGLGLEQPRIFVEVKHRRHETIGSEMVRSFLGGRRDGDRCIYISTGGFSREARYEAERSAIPITLVTLPDLRELVLRHYELLDLDTRALIPLKRIYLPIED